MSGCVIDSDFYKKCSEDAKRFADNIHNITAQMGYKASTLAVAAGLDRDIFDDVEHIFDRLDIDDFYLLRLILGCKASDLLD